MTGPAITKWGRRGCPRNEDRSYNLGEVCAWLRTGACDVRRLPQVEALRVLGVSKPALREFEKRGCPRNRDGTYDATRVVPWRLAELQQRIAAARKMSAREAAQARRAESDAAMRELDLAERRGELVSRPAVVAGWIARIQTVKACLMGLVGRLGGQGFGDDQVELVRTEMLGIVRRLATGQVALQLTPAAAKALEAVLAELPGGQPKTAGEKRKRTKAKQGDDG